MNQLACFQRTRGMVKALGLSVVLLLNATHNLAAQDGPPVPPTLPPTQPPREPTPEELEAQRKLLEAHHAKNLERFQNHLIKTVDQLAGRSPVDGKFLSLDGLLWMRLEGGKSVEERALETRNEEERRLSESRSMSIPLYSRSPDGDGAAFKGLDESGRPIFRISASLNSAKTIQTDHLWPGGTLGLNLTGNNGTIAMWDLEHPSVNHSAFGTSPNARLTILDWYSFPDYPTTDHATRVAGILGGAQGTGSPGSNAKGMAFGAAIHAYNDNAEGDEMQIAYTNYGAVRITSHNYTRDAGWNILVVSNLPAWVWRGDTNLSQIEDGVFGRYDGSISNIDHVSFIQPYQLSVRAVGNEGISGRGKAPPTQPTNHYLFLGGPPTLVTNITRPADGDAGGYDTLPSEATAKNPIIVGSITNLPTGYQGTNSVLLSSFSSFGPSDAGLIKPDLVAAGENVWAPVHPDTFNADTGTSFAAPSVAGSLLLLREHFLNTNTNYTNVLASTLKAIAIHTADEVGADGPDFKHGWGLMNTAKAAQLISSNVTTGGAHIFEILLQTNKPYLGHVWVSDSNQILKASIVWTDPAGIAAPLPLAIDPTNSVLRNDIDLRLISPSGQSIQPWVLDPDIVGKSAANRALPAVRGDDIWNPVEQVMVRAPQLGFWKISITHKRTNLLGAAGTSVTHQPVSLVVSGNADVVVSPITILDIAPVPGNQLAFLFSTEAGRWYNLQWINPVTASVWADLAAVNAQSDVTAITIPLPSTNRFYRVLRTQ